jgi:hypothetical protein
MSYELQKALAIESYKIIDLHEFVKMCRYIDQTLRDVNNKFRNIREDFANDVEREKITIIVNSNQNNQINQNADKSISRSRFEIFESSSRATTQSSEDQMNSLNCYNCEKSEHFFRNYRQLRKQMNSNSYVREIDVYDKNDLSNENLEIESKKE